VSALTLLLTESRAIRTFIDVTLATILLGLVVWFVKELRHDIVSTAKELTAFALCRSSPEDAAAAEPPQKEQQVTETGQRMVV
jgi:hypothetical protein